jgi:phosphopantothenoylcysteine decarboxylase / phosphopantothenate---cysteine ligase
MPPKAGHLACGTSGAGRLPEALEIRAFVDNFFAQQDGDLKGLKFLVTAAGTREAIDPVRFIGNRSSGKMGYAITQDILARGGQVVLVSGPSALTPPLGAEFVSVESTEQMLEAVLKYYEGVDVVIKAAAVADYKPHEVATQKIKKQATDDFTLKLDKNPDILKILGEKKTHQFLVGFAAETQHLLENAQAKLQKKNLDMIVANDVTAAGAGFNADTNIVKFLYPDGTVEEVPKMSKDAVGMALLDVVRSKLKDF